MTVPADSSVPTKLLLIDHDHDFFIFSCNYRSLLKKSIKIKIFYFLQ